MDTTTSTKPKTLAELLPGLSGILSKDCMQTLTAKKQPRHTIIVNTHTAGKITKPLTIAEMRADISSLRVQSPRRPAQGATSSKKKKNWNSSVKVDKTVSHTANGKMKHNPVRKVLNFQPKPKPVNNIRATMAPESPKFTRPEFRPKKYSLQARSNVRISGRNNIADTPVVNKPIISQTTQTLPNKENVSNQTCIREFPPPKPLMNKKLIPVIPDTPMSNESWKSSCDASFLQNEKEINDAEEKTKAIAEESTLENIAAVTPPVSTPFKEYRNVHEYFNHSSELENSAVYHDNTIMSFEKPTDSKANTKREESVIVSLCDLLNKASVANSGKMSTELEDLLQIEKQIEHDLKMIDKIKQSQLTFLQYIRKLINDKKLCASGDKTLTKKTPKVISKESHVQ